MSAELAAAYAKLSPVMKRVLALQPGDAQAAMHCNYDGGQILFFAAENSPGLLSNVFVADPTVALARIAAHHPTCVSPVLTRVGVWFASLVGDDDEVVATASHRDTLTSVLILAGQ